MSEQFINQPLEDEISMKDIIDFLVESWKVIALSGIFGVFLAAGYAFNTPPKYKATANIQVAKIAGSDVEAPGALVEKLKMPMYYSTESYSACGVMEKIEPGITIAKNLDPKLSKASNIISFSFVAESREDAQKCLESILNDVRKNQNLLAKPIIETKNNQLANLKQKLDIAERIVSALPNKNLTYDFSDSQFSAATLIFSTILSKEIEINDLKTLIKDLEISLKEPQTNETFLITPIHAAKQEVPSKGTLILMGGLASGLFFGLLIIIGKRSWHSYKTSIQ